MEEHPNSVIVETLELLTEDKLQEIYNLVDALIPVISSVRGSWYKEIMRLRFEHLLQIYSSVKDSVPRKIKAFWFSWYSNGRVIVSHGRFYLWGYVMMQYGGNHVMKNSGYSKNFLVLTGL